MNKGEDQEYDFIYDEGFMLEGISEEELKAAKKAANEDMRKENSGTNIPISRPSSTGTPKDK